MMYSDNKTKIRRFIRDPKGNIWDDPMLLNLWNDEQRIFSREYGFNETPTILRVPPAYQMGYCHEWEWGHNQHAQGRTFRLGIYNRQTPAVCTAVWETQALGLGTGSDAEQGHRFTQPWEAYMVPTPADLTPVWWPSDFHSVVFMAFDNDPLEPIDFKRLTSQDISYRSYQGSPQNYVIKDDLSQEFYLYPRPAAVWDDVDGSGVVVHTDFATEDSETGTIVDATGAETSQNEGAAIDYLRADDNVLLVYRNRTEDIAENADEPGIPRYLQKYIEYGVIARAYKANTDGKIQSLADYWDWRKSISKEVLLRLRYKRLQDRDFRLTGGRPPVRQRRGPKLPSTYPPV
jgi:hypothetical protein